MPKRRKNKKGTSNGGLEPFTSSTLSVSPPRQRLLDGETGVEAEETATRTTPKPETELETDTPSGTMILGPVSYLDCLIFCILLAPQLLWRVGLVDKVVCILRAVPFLGMWIFLAFLS